MTEIIKSKLIRTPQSAQINPYQQVYGGQPAAAGPVYPNRHSGRQFTNLLPNQQRIILPVRGEKVIKTTEMLAQESQQNIHTVQKDIKKQAEELNKLIGDIKNNKEMQQILQKKQAQPVGLELHKSSPNQDPGQNQQTTAPIQSPQQVAEPKVEQLSPAQSVNTSKPETTPEEKPPQQTKQEVKEEKPTQLQMKTASQVKQEIAAKDKEKNKPLEAAKKENGKKAEKKKKKGFFARLFGKKDKETTSPMTEIPNEVEHKEVKAKQPKQEKKNEPQANQEHNMPGISPINLAANVIKNAVTNGPKYANIQPLTNNPNCFSGIVLDSAGKTLNGLVVVIKTETGEPVRAVKTNQVGQFVITTPLTNGVYTVTVDPANNAKAEFENVKVKLEGNVLKPLEFKGK